MDSVAEYEHSLRRARHQFTIFELILVVAILLILGSMLFPIYGGPHRSKLSASLSNAKQLALSLLMYANDYDDHFVIVGQWNSNDPDAHKEYPKSPYMPWTGLVEGYLKNCQILNSPMTNTTQPFTGPGKNACTTHRSCDLLYPTYGYNGVYLSPSILNKRGGAHIEALSNTAVAKPHEQVLLTEIWSRNLTHFGATSSGANDAYINFATVEAPDGATDLAWGKPYGRLSWGRYSKQMDALLRTPTEGQGTAGVAFRYDGRTPVVFADGHTKALKADMLAIGTDWNPNLTAKAHNLKNGKYMWDPRGL